jgi:hypothetical protein
MKRMIAMENPLLIGYDETAFADRLFYNELDPHAACSLVEMNRLLTYEILRRLQDDVFQRTGIHNERGKITLGEYLSITVDHMEHHLVFIHRKRKLLAPPQ